MTKQHVYQIDDNAFINAVKISKNIHEALKAMGLNARGAAYKTFKIRCKKLHLDLSHFVNEKELRKSLLPNKIIAACENNNSRQATLKQLELNPHAGANIAWLNKQINILHISTKHWTGKGHLKNRTHDWANSIPLEEILVKNSSYLWNSNLKRRLLKIGLLENRCYHPSCGISEWHGQKLSLQLEHKNGDHTDNRIENLCLLCPNCHSLTETFAGRNKRGRQGGT